MKSAKPFEIKVRPPVSLRPEPSDIANRAGYWFGVRSGELYGLGTVYGLDLLQKKWEPFLERGRPDADSFERMKANSEPWVNATGVERDVRVEVILRERYTNRRLELIQLTRGWGVPASALWGAILDVGMPSVEELLRELRPGYAAWVDSGAEKDAWTGAVQELWSVCSRSEIGETSESPSVGRLGSSYLIPKGTDTATAESNNEMTISHGGVLHHSP